MRIFQTAHQAGLALTFAIGLVVGVGGCGSPAFITDPIIYGHGGMSPSAEAERSNRHTDYFIKQQLSGKSLEHYPTWKAFWLNWCQRAPKYSTTPEVAQWEIVYTRLALRRAGLPTYDQ